MNNNLNEYKNWLEKRLLTAETIRGKLWAIKKYGEKEVNTENIIDFLKNNLDKYKPNSLRLLYNSLNSYAKFLKTYIEKELIVRVIPKIQNPFYPTINKEELAKLKSVTKTTQTINERNNLMLDFLLYTGIRVKELVNIRHSDYANNGMFKVLGKGNKIRTVPLPDFLERHFKPNSSDYLKLEAVKN